MGKRLTLEKRQLIEGHRSDERSLRWIARALGVSASTISREVRRNGGCDGYDAVSAQVRSAVMRVGIGPPLVSGMAWSAAQAELAKRHSPEQIAGHRSDISASTIRRRIAVERLQGGMSHRHLRRRGKQRLSAAARALCRCNNIPHRIHYGHRPLAADARSENGHWEMDTMWDIGTHGRAGALVLTDRKSRLACLAALPKRTARAVAQAAVTLLKPHPCHSITADNGGEFAKHHLITQALGAPVFFTDPGSPWQRGTCENTISLIRDLTPKQRLGSMNPAAIRRIANAINHRPMKLHHWQTRFMASSQP